MKEVRMMSGKDMDKGIVKQNVEAVFHNTDGNYVTESMTEDPDLVGVPLFDEPLAGFASAHDPLFREYKKPDVIGPWFMTPEEWLPDAESVVSIFLPFSDAVKQSNRVSDKVPSQLWLLGRVEGQAFIAKFAGALRDMFQGHGISACAPGIDPRFRAIKGGKGMSGFPEINEQTYGSNWSERHAAYAAGLGTFGLSKGLITRRGMAGRFTSLILSDTLEPDFRPYTGIYDYCIMCGACIHRCPADAITMENGKDHTVCGPWLSRTAELYSPRFGCGKCQTGVPCESGIPGEEKSR
jgi:epoxyqueuosine reductase